jgi:hypothetical protein
MALFYESVLQNMSTSTVAGSWNLDGYSEFNFYTYFQGPAGSRVQISVYCNNIVTFDQQLNLVQGIGYIATPLRVFAPNVSVVAYNPSATMNGRVRLYAACCSQQTSIWQMFKFPLSMQSRVLPKSGLDKFERPPDGT